MSLLKRDFLVLILIMGVVASKRFSEKKINPEM